MLFCCQNPLSYVQDVLSPSLCFESVQCKRKILFGSSEVLAEIELKYNSQGSLLLGIATLCPHAGVALLMVQTRTAQPWVLLFTDCNVNGALLELGRVMALLRNSHPNIWCQPHIPLSLFFFNKNCQFFSIHASRDDFYVSHRSRCSSRKAQPCSAWVWAQCRKASSDQCGATRLLFPPHTA